MKKPLQCLRPFLSQIQSQEQTQEVRLPDSYPDIGRILGCWGQILVRGKEWRGASMGANGGVMGWVMYAPEDGTQPRVVDVWIPFQSRWDFHEDMDDGTVMLHPILTSLDARGISARKIMVRAGLDVLGQAMGKAKVEIAAPTEVPEDIQLLTQSYPVDLPVESGEKQVQLEENLAMPSVQPMVHKIVSYDLMPSIQEQKVLGNRLVFRGQAGLHMIYMTEDGEIHHWETEIPFSQYTELDRDYGPTATAWVLPILTAMEMDISQEKQLQLRAGIAAQYTVFDQSMLDIVEDAFSTKRDVSVKKEEMQLPVILDHAQMEMAAVAQLDDRIRRIEKANVHTQYPVARTDLSGMQIGMDGQFQLLYWDEEDQLQGENVHFESDLPFSSSMDNQLQLWVGNPTQPEVLPSNEGMSIRCRYPLTAQVYAGTPISMVTELELGELREPDPNRPAIILRRAGEDGLWEIAKSCGSSIKAIQEANHLTEEPEIGQMLLIPVQ